MRLCAPRVLFKPSRQTRAVQSLELTSGWGDNVRSKSEEQGWPHAVQIRTNPVG